MPALITPNQCVVFIFQENCFWAAGVDVDGVLHSAAKQA